MRIPREEDLRLVNMPPEEILHRMKLETEWNHDSVNLITHLGEEGPRTNKPTILREKTPDIANHHPCKREKFKIMLTGLIEEAPRHHIERIIATREGDLHHLIGPS